MEIINNKIPQKLQTIFDSVEYEEFGTFLIDFLKIDKDDNVEFLFNINISGFYPEKEIEENHRWRLIIPNCKEYRIEDSKNFESFCYIFSEHILLSHFKENWTELYIKSEGENLNNLFIDFYNLHKIDFDDFINFEKYIKQNLNLAIQSKNALFARGPKNIMSKYFTLLQKYSKEPYYLTNVNSIYKNSEKNKNLKILFAGNNYFIAENFEFQEI